MAPEVHRFTEATNAEYTTAALLSIGAYHN